MLASNPKNDGLVMMLFLVELMKSFVLLCLLNTYGLNNPSTAVGCPYQ